jgi:hypothetical protein
VTIDINLDRRRIAVGWKESTGEKLDGINARVFVGIFSIWGD